ncbi:site-specific integrase [Aureimonas psammosilenae]|uniref:site-specific integrase n=1 Tax=Aureimonas psammosilenae TaxID=2495496 RepID=UPI00126104FE|nr:site-specific integrase [Aureimonas psammosilenae]
MYWLRRRVPADLVAIVGKREELVSLRTKDAEEAKKRHLAALAEVEARWDTLRAGPATISEREALEIVREFYDRWIELHREEPGSQTQWRTDLFEGLWQVPYIIVPFASGGGHDRDLLERPPQTTHISAPPPDLGAFDPNATPIRRMQDLCVEGAEALLKRRGLRTDALGRSKVVKAIGKMLQQASLALAASAKGDGFWPTAFATSEPPTASGPVQKKKAQTTFSIDDAFKLWIAEKRPRERTIYEWKRVLNELATFVGHRDADRLSVDDLLRWKNALLEAKRAPKTIRDAKIAPVRAILQVAVENRKLDANPAEKVTLTVKKVAAEARRDFTDPEAVTVLKAAMKEKSPSLRWVPWICAYSGARLSEACQLRREDVHEHEGVWVMRFAAEAGPLKNANSERALPLHPALIENGFLDFTKTVKSGPLFTDLPPDKFGKRGGNGTKVIGRWVRKLGLTDTRLAPNHSWRHRFKTLGRRYDLRLDIVDAMTGHAAKNVGNAYGIYPMAAMLRELEKIPILKLDKGSSA